MAFFNYPETMIDAYKFHCDLDISRAFMACASEQLGKSFATITGISANKEISFSIPDKERFSYEKGPVSKIHTVMYVNHNWNPTTFSWHSKSGRIYNISDEDIDCEDIIFTFEGLDPLLIQKQMYPKEKLPFKLKDLTYELTIERLNMEMTIEASFKPDSVIDTEKISDEAIAFVGKFNEKLLKKNYSGVHNFKPEIQGDKICFDIDTGYTGPVFLKQFLRFLSDKNVFVTVSVI